MTSKLKSGYRILRGIVVAGILAVAVIPALTYLLLSLSGVQASIAHRAESQLSQLLGAHVTIGDLGIVPFNRVVLRDVTVETAPGDTALTIERLGAGVALWEALFTDRWKINYVELIGMDARLHRADRDAPLNIQPIIDALSPKDRNKPPTRFDVKVQTIVIRKCAVSYDVDSEPRLTGRFDPNHLRITHWRADVNLPRIANDDFTVDLRRMAFEEQGGLRVEQLGVYAHYDKKALTLKDLSFSLPSSQIDFEDIRLPSRGRTNVSVASGSHLWLPDIQAFVPVLAEMPIRIDMASLTAEGDMNGFAYTVDLESPQILNLYFKGDCDHIRDQGRSVVIQEGRLKADAPALTRHLRALPGIPESILRKISALGDVSIQIKGGYRKEAYDYSATLHTALGALTSNGEGILKSVKQFTADAEIATDGYVDLTPLIANGKAYGFDGIVSGSYDRMKSAGDGRISLSTLVAEGITLREVDAEGTLDGKNYTLNLNINDENLALVADGALTLRKGDNALTLNADLRHFLPDRLGLWQKYPGAVLQGALNVEMAGENWRHMEGEASLHDVSLKPVDSQAIVLNNLTVTAEHRGESGTALTLASDYLNGSVSGEFDLPFLPHACMDILSEAFPALLPAHAGHDLEQEQAAHLRRNPGAQSVNDFQFDFTINETEPLAHFFNWPVSVIYPVKIRGGVSQVSHDMELNLSAPYLRQGSKLIENTTLSAFVDGDDNRARLNFSTTAPTKNGPMTLALEASGFENLLRSTASWKIDRARAYEGEVRTATTFSRDEEGLVTRIDLRPSHLTFNDSTWTINPASITIAGRDIRVDSIDVFHGRQFVKINGTVSPDPLALLTLDLSDFSLDYLFESLGIDAAMLGGDATGTFYASDLFSGSPRLETPGLHVSNISYNHTVLGDAVVRSHFDPATMGVMLDADLDNHGRLSTVNGGIYVTRDSLDLTFHVDREPVGFLQPYMEAFASDIKGYASGWARVYGNFKYIDLEGDVKADSVQMRLNFTNTTYWATDSVHIRPGYIDLNGITVHDMQGNTANLNGWVKHTFFKEPRFEFGITGAHGLLAYDETPKDNPRWYGRVYGDGAAYVRGEPGIVDIAVDMTTAPGSTFTFVLSDQLEAEQYSFLTFRDGRHDGAGIGESITLRDTSMDLVNELRRRAAAHDSTSTSDYNISIQMGITPRAQINLVMDPIGGDRIRAYGAGHLRMDYGSANNDLKMFGTYTLERGDYNFTLQDIIIKDFIIRPGSEITFNGDPYAAQLDIQAAYSLNANLTDLDESFLNDNDLNRTNVPVNAIMKVSGDIRQPEIAFDLEFPTLTSDVYRKVRSIISTDEMMNRQILYLLALNRFSTPDYMAGATRGNELVSVASSTISSQLSSILGQISDNWAIAPAFRSSRGDFSDVEVDVALSSRLLNNRLLFNGNFGYRDKSLNTNQFVGDFDLEYLLNRGGTFRLKAYNRYNDQNYYLRSALTTQGVGFIIRKDFDSLTSFLRPLFRHKPKEEKEEEREKEREKEKKADEKESTE